MERHIEGMYWAAKELSCHPLVRPFYENRDTLLYAGLAAWVGYSAFTGGVAGVFNCGAWVVANAREVCRPLAWGVRHSFNDGFSLTGGREERRVNSWHVMMAVFTPPNAIGMLTGGIGWNAVASLLVFTAMGICGGPKGVLDGLKTAWNFHENDDGGWRQALKKWGIGKINSITEALPSYTPKPVAGRYASQGPAL